MEKPTFNIEQAKAFIREANNVRDGGHNETVTRQTLVAGLADTFPAEQRPWWVERHIKGAERHVQFDEDGTTRRGFVDSVVGLTAIEYEYDLRDGTKFAVGHHQVRQYCAGLLNEGAEATLIRGILSDGVDWFAYQIAEREDPVSDTYRVEDVELIELESLSCNDASDLTVNRWVDFLFRHLGREGTRPLTAHSVAEYLGFDSGFGYSYLVAFDTAIQEAMDEDKSAAHLVQSIWTSFVSYLSGNCEGGDFDVAVYVQEFYLTILARLICANVIAKRAIRSDEGELNRILNGQHFEAKGLHRLVEHDYFGWLSSDSHVGRIRPLAAAIQADLAAYDFTVLPAEDVFGELLTMLAERSHRLLLGQEWTPAWLANIMAERMFDALPDNEPPRFVDMCCGSGAMIVAVARLAMKRLEHLDIAPGSREAMDYLVQAATGFDIDPLAVVLAKVNWVVANRDWLEPFDGSHAVSLPIYHADSLFALAPIFDNEPAEHGSSTDYTLRLLDHPLTLPRFLIAPETQVLFDGLLERAYSLAMVLAEDADSTLNSILIDGLLSETMNETETDLTPEQNRRTATFILDFVRTLTSLQRDGLNGIWVFVIRNSYRPGLVAGQFNGIISNPPWLALSKIAGNPFERVLKERAEHYALTPSGSAFLHLDMATTFLAHSVDHFLADGGRVACILPDTVRNGTQHDPFRAQIEGREGTELRIKLSLDELWQVDTGVFRNRAMVMFGHKAEPSTVERYDGRLVSAETSTKIAHYPAAFGSRLVWSPNPPGDGVPGGYPPGFASQGADIMPRSLVMVSTQSASGERTTIATPSRGGNDWYLLSDAKKHKNFSATPCTLPSRFIHKCLISKHVGPFVIASPATTALPIIREGCSWKRALATEIATSPPARDHFNEIIEESDFGSLDEFWDNGLNYRHKLTKQNLEPGSWLVVYGAGGGIPAAAYAQVQSFGDAPPVIDQTLYWIATDDEQEALFIVGVINSDILLERIADFIPQGDFGDRHLHTLPSIAVPQFDPADETHARMVEVTRVLYRELQEHRGQQPTQSLFTTEVSMTVRRRRLRKLIQELSSYEEYTATCRVLFEGINPS